jgi:predicted acyltransferase
MIIVNTPGKGAPLYPYLVHAKWFGVTVADLVFPAFLFAVGNAMSFSPISASVIDRDVFLTRIIRRTLIMFLIGFLLYWFPFFVEQADGSLAFKSIGHTRIMGVLQRIALCYFIAVLLVRFFSIRLTVMISAGLLLTYWFLLYVFGDDGSEFSMAGNAIVKFDLFVVGENHVYKRDVIPFDPEGLLSTLPAVVNVLAGYWAGVFIQQKGRTYECLTKLLVAGSILMAAGLWWDLIFPISKKIWTSSFVLYTVGVDVMVLAVLMYMIELKNINFANYFFSCFGRNPLFIYLVSELLYIILSLIKLSSGVSVFEWISINIFQRAFPGSFGSFMTAVVFMLFCWALGWMLDKKKIFIRI